MEDDDDDDDVNIPHDRQRSVAFVLKFALFFAFLRRGSFFLFKLSVFFLSCMPSLHFILKSLLCLQ